MPNEIITFQNVSFGYENMVSPLLKDVSLTFSHGWTGIVGPNGAGKTTLMRLMTGDLHPTSGSILSTDNILYCEQRTDHKPEGFDSLVDGEDSAAFRIQGQLDIQLDWKDRWDTLSHGERKRAQIASALWQRPIVLAVDEPTNHLDEYARHLLVSSLKMYHGIGIIISHDRELLDSLCYQCVFLNPPDAVLRPGSYSQGAADARIEVESAQSQFEEKKRVLQRLKRESSKRRDSAAQSHNRRSKKGIALKDNDARFKKNRARISGRDGTGGKLLNQMDGRLNQAKSEFESIHIQKDYSADIWVPGEKSRKRFLINLPAGQIEIFDKTVLEFPDLLVGNDDRVAITGKNGTGKSTLLRYLLERLTLPNNKILYIPQEISVEASRKALHDSRNLPPDALGKVLSIFSRLGSKADRLLESQIPSPGEVRKLILALGIENQPHLIVLDEPTNHMDLPSIENIEQALAGCPCGMIMVSHDTVFLKKLTRQHWRIDASDYDDGVMKLSIEA